MSHKKLLLLLTCNTIGYVWSALGSDRRGIAEDWEEKG